MGLRDMFKSVLHAARPSDGMFDEVGAIILDDTPLVQHLPALNGDMSMRERLEQYFSSERLRAAQDALGEETFEEALDFGPDDEDHPGSPYSVDDERHVFEANERFRQGQGRAAPAGLGLDADENALPLDSPPTTGGRPKPPKRPAKAPFDDDEVGS